MSAGIAAHSLCNERSGRARARWVRLSLPRMELQPRWHFAGGTPHAPRLRRRRARSQVRAPSRHRRPHFHLLRGSSRSASRTSRRCSAAPRASTVGRRPRWFIGRATPCAPTGNSSRRIIWSATTARRRIPSTPGSTFMRDRRSSTAKPTSGLRERTRAQGIAIPDVDHWCEQALPGQEAVDSLRSALAEGTLSGSEDGKQLAPIMGQFADFDGGVTFSRCRLDESFSCVYPIMVSFTDSCRRRSIAPIWKSRGSCAAMRARGSTTMSSG